MWHLFHARHFAVAHFVWDLARFFFLALIDHRALERGQGAQGANRALGSDVQSLERGDETVPAEWGDEPGNTGGAERPIRKGGIERGQIGRALAEHVVEQEIAGNQIGCWPNFGMLDHGRSRGRYKHYLDRESPDAAWFQTDRKGGGDHWHIIWFDFGRAQMRGQMGQGVSDRASLRPLEFELGILVEADFGRGLALVDA